MRKETSRPLLGKTWPASGKLFSASGPLAWAAGIPAFLMALAGSASLLERVFCPFQVNQGEAINVEFARLILRGEALYHDPSQGPYLYAAYPPLFPLLQALFLKILPGPWLPGRLMAFAGFLGCALALGFWGWRHWTKPAALAISFLFLLSPTWASWGTMVRTDAPMIFLEFTAFLLLAPSAGNIKGGAREGVDGRLLMAGGLTCLALFLKQNAVLLVLAYGFYCLLEKRPRSFFIYALAALGPVLAVFLFLQWETSGWFFKYTFLWAPLGFQSGLLIHYLSQAFLPECGWLLAGVLLAWNSPGNTRLNRCMMACALLWVLGLGREGSAENYFLEFILFGLFFIGEAWGAPASARVKGAWNLHPAWFIGLLVCGLLSFSAKPWPSAPAPEERENKLEAAAIYQEPGEHLALDLDLPLLAGRRLWVQPLEYSLMVQKGIWSDEPLLRDIRAKKFATVEIYDLPEQYLLPKPVVEEIQNNYRVKIRKFGRLWLVPIEPEKAQPQAGAQAGG